MKENLDYDPNSHLDCETVSRGVMEARKALLATGVPWQPVEYLESRSIIRAYFNLRWHVVYVRVITEEPELVGAGQVPPILIEYGKHIYAKYQAIVQVHLAADGAIRLIGFQNLIPKLRFQTKAWSNELLGGRSALEYLSMIGGKPSVLTLKLNYEPIWPKPGTEAERIAALRNQYPILGNYRFTNGGEYGESHESEDDFVKRRLAETRDLPTHGHFFIELEADRLPRYSLALSMGALLDSTTWNNYWEIYTCDCGSTGCAGAGRGVAVIHESGLTVWRVHGLKPRRILVFDQQQYRKEILTKIKVALAVHQQYPSEVRFGDVYFNDGSFEQRRWVEVSLAHAEQFTPHSCKQKMSDKSDKAKFDSAKLAAKAVQRLKQHGTFMLDADGQDANPARFVIKPQDEPYLKQEPSQAERDKRRELHDLAMQALTASQSLRPVWLEVLRTLKQFCDGDGDYRNLIIARMSMEATLAGVWVGLNARCSNAAAALACYHACNPDLNAAIEQTKAYHQRAVEWATPIDKQPS